MTLRRLAFITVTLALILGCSSDESSSGTPEPNASSSAALSSDSELSGIEAASSSSESSSTSSQNFSSQGSSCGFQETDTDRLATQRDIWEAQGIDDYVFEFHYTRYSYYATNADFRNKVIDGIVVSSLNLSTSSASGYPISIDDVFDRASGAISYDETYGFVTTYSNQDVCAYDTYSSFSLLTFTPLDDNNITTEDHMKALDSQIDTMMSNQSCYDSSECESIAYGAKACGGPIEYLIYSTQSVDINELQPLVNAYNAYNETYNEANSVISDCMFVTPPELECSSIEGLPAGTCNIVTSATASSQSN